MAVMYKKVVVPYTARQMYQLVNDVECYPDFIHWCQKTEVIQETADVVKATLFIHAYGFDQKLVTSNTLIQDLSIHMAFLEGPFAHFSGVWLFADQADSLCEVQCTLDYEFSSESSFLRMISPFFDHVSNGFVDLFVRRAQVLYAVQPGSLTGEGFLCE